MLKCVFQYLYVTLFQDPFHNPASVRTAYRAEEKLYGNGQVPPRRGEGEPCPQSLGLISTLELWEICTVYQAAFSSFYFRM